MNAPQSSNLRWCWRGDSQCLIRNHGNPLKRGTFHLRNSNRCMLFLWFQQELPFKSATTVNYWRIEPQLSGLFTNNWIRTSPETLTHSSPHCHAVPEGIYLIAIVTIFSFLTLLCWIKSKETLQSIFFPLKFNVYWPYQRDREQTNNSQRHSPPENRLSCCLSL